MKTEYLNNGDIEFKDFASDTEGAVVSFRPLLGVGFIMGLQAHDSGDFIEFYIEKNELNEMVNTLNKQL